MNEELRAEKSKALFNLHFKKVFQEAVKLANLNGNEVILDFGCGNKLLKQFLPKGCKYYGYDSAESRRDIPSIYAMPERADVAFAMHVFEHIPSTKLEYLLEEFKSIGLKRLVVSLPADNTLNNIMKFIYGNDALTFFYHVNSSKNVAIQLQKAFGIPIAFKRVDGIKFLAVYNVAKGIQTKKEAGK